MTMLDTDLHSKLEALGAKIDATLERFRQESALFKSEQHLTGTQLEERYRMLKARLDGEVGQVEAHGRHVSDLEKSVRSWIDSLDARL
jgi:hypothetical protein